jgi:FKBP-type peptidyl-prolyl cis-trans isomerase FkpA
MILKKWIFVLLSVAVLLTVSCKKDDDSGTEQAAIDKALIQQYIKDNNLDADSTASGLYYVINDPGGSEHPNRYSTVTVAYAGYLLNGDVFDESLSFTSTLSSLIPGWTEGIQLIGRGGKIKLIIPSELGYGSQETGSIPANSVLVFDITLYDFAN